MNRPIKFRAKRTDNGMWAYGYFVKTPITTEFSADGQFLDTGIGRYCIIQDSVAHEIDIETLGQDTGMLDSDDKEIWEGDIVRAGRYGANPSHHVGQIRYGGNEAMFFIEVPDGDKPKSYGLCGWRPSPRIKETLEVLGNIHENPDLLK